VLLKLIILFTVIPLTELYLLMWLAQVADSAALVFLLVVLTGVVGASLARWQGAGTLRRLNLDLNQGRMPHDALLDGLLIFVAGAFLLTPGILTDALGFSLLIPPLRTVVKRLLIHRFKSRFEAMSGGGPPGGRRDPPFDRDKIIEARLIDPKNE
jgi:UPF0716 protein FxsA